MRKPQESAADRVWKEKLESCPSLREAAVLLVVIGALLAGAFIGA